MIHILSTLKNDLTSKSKFNDVLPELIQNPDGSWSKLQPDGSYEEVPNTRILKVKDALGDDIYVDSDDVGDGTILFDDNSLIVEYDEDDIITGNDEDGKEVIVKKKDEQLTGWKGLSKTKKYIP